MASKKEMIQLLNVNQGVGNSRMEREKYEIYAQAILEAVPADREGIRFKELSREVERRLPRARRPELGSVTWHTTTVKLDLEARGLIERIPGSKPQRLRRRSDP